MHQFSLGVEHQLPWNVKVDASYVGSRTVNINTNDNQSGGARNLNVNTAAQLAQARQDSNYFNQAVPNPFAGLLAGTGLNGATIRRQQLLLPFPEFGNVSEGQESVGKISYDSAQLSVEKRYTAGLALVAAYTFSKNLESVAFLNNQDPRPTRNLTSSDRPHRLVLSGVYQLQFGRGKYFGKSVGRGWDRLIGGWEYNFIGTIQSGTPLDLPGNVDIIGNPAASNQSFNTWFNPCVVQQNGAALRPNTSHTKFDQPCSNPAWSIRGPFVRNPWAKQWDMSLNKRFNITERYNAQFRFEAFNVFNTPIRGGPNTNPTDPNFGFVGPNQSNFPRQVQLGFKFNF